MDRGNAGAAARIRASTLSREWSWKGGQPTSSSYASTPTAQLSTVAE
jgi:hypothetical protein